MGRGMWSDYAAIACMLVEIRSPQDSLAEWPKALASGASPQGREREPPQLSYEVSAGACDLTRNAILPNHS